MCVTMSHTCPQVDHGCFWTQRQVGGHPQDCANPFGDQIPVVQETGHRAAVQVGYDE